MYVYGTHIDYRTKQNSLSRSSWNRYLHAIHHIYKYIWRQTFYIGGYVSIYAYILWWNHLYWCVLCQSKKCFQHIEPYTYIYIYTLCRVSCNFLSSADHLNTSNYRLIEQRVAWKQSNGFSIFDAHVFNNNLKWFEVLTWCRFRRSLMTMNCRLTVAPDVASVAVQSSHLRCLNSKIFNSTECTWAPLYTFGILICEIASGSARH